MGLIHHFQWRIQGRTPPYFLTKLRPEGPKKFFLRRPTYLRVCMTAHPPLSEGLDLTLILEFATKGILALSPFKIGKVSSFLGCVP